MKKYKGLIIFVVILVIYSLIMFFFFNNNDNNNANNNSNSSSKSNVVEEEKYLVIDNSSVLSYSNNTFSETRRTKIESLDSLKVYVNNSFYGNYKLKYVSNWNLLDKKNEFVNYNGKLIAYSNNFNIDIKKYKVREINDSDKVFLINNYNLNTFDYLTTNEVVDIDLDNNGVNDEIICLSSMEASSNINNYYNLVVVRLNNEKYTLIEEKGENAYYVYSLHSIINIENNSHDSIILSKIEGYISENPKETNLVYNYKNNNYMID